MIGKPDLTKFNDTIRGPRFNLVPMREDHQTIISQIVRDIEKTHGDIDQEGLHLDAVFKYQSERLFYLLIKMHAGGYAGYLELDDMNTDEPEIGVNIMESYRRQGIGPEALLLLLPYLRANYRQQNYIGRVFSDNTDSQKMMQRIGAKLLRTEATPVEKVMEVAKRLLEDQKVVEEVMRRYANKNQTVLVYQLP